MRRRSLGRWTASLFLACVLVGSIAAQSSTPEDQNAKHPEQTNATTEQGSGGNGNAGVGVILAQTTEQSAHTAEKWGRKIGLGPDTSFLISLFLNFAGVFAFFYFLLKSKLPQAFRERTAAIQKGIKDAEAASADASRRLSEIETRLAKLDSEVAGIRASAESDAAAEEQRIKQAAEEDKQKVIAAAQTEIAAIARSARRELKGYAASLAVDLAAREIRVDEPTDQALVREFVDQLGKDGK
jgi:F-type H+-transporting ATPase subunit b